MKPLFIPLRTQWFDEFLCGEKDTEYRKYGPRWNESTCAPGRPVTLSHGYSGQRLSGVIKGFSTKNAAPGSPGAEIYGDNALLAAITIELKLD